LIQGQEVEHANGATKIMFEKEDRVNNNEDEDEDEEANMSRNNSNDNTLKLADVSSMIPVSTNSISTEVDIDIINDRYGPDIILTTN